MANQSVSLKASGLQTFYQTLLEISPGALLKANNIVIDRSGVIAPRRGITLYSSQAPSQIKQLLEYKKRVLRHVGSKLQYDNGVGIFSDFNGDHYETDVGYRLKSLEFKSNFYFATLNGVKKISATSPSDFSIPDVVQDIGAAKGIAGILELNGTSGFLLKGSTVSYRLIWLYTDRNKNLVLGSPSASMVITNGSSGDSNVQLRFQVPYGVESTDYKYRIYRSEMSTFGTPSDETYQVYEANITSSQLTAREVVVVDSLPESLRIGGVPLYTNQYSGEGILKSNDLPPAAKDIAIFNNHMFYANTRSRHTIISTLISVSGFTAGVSNFIINGSVYTFDLVENASLKRVKLGTVEETIQSLVRVINADANEIVSAYYLSLTGETPGKFLLERKTLVDQTFYLGTSDASIAVNFTPTLGTGPTLTTQCLSASEKYGNRVYYSKFLEIEAVPITFYLDLGSKDQEIKRIMPFRNSLYVFKEDGVWQITGEGGPSPSFSFSVYDNTSFIKGPDTVVTLGNQCYYFSNQGIVLLNDSNSQPISKPIEDKLIPFISTAPFSLETASFAVAYESDRALLFWTISRATDTIATVCYRYNIVTNAWTEWRISKTCGITNQHLDKLYLGSSDNYVEVERKNFNRFDYADRESITELLPNKLSSNIVLLPIFSSLALGDVVLQEQYLTLTEINSTLKHLDLDAKLKVSGFYNDLKMSIGDNLTTTMVNLRDKLRLADPSADWSGPDSKGNTDYEFSPTTDFLSIQNQFNDMVDRLNESPNSFLKNYIKSSGIKRYEANITSLNNITLEITLSVPPAFIQGKLIVYKGIVAEIEYAPNSADDPAGFKQFSSGTFMFERKSFFTIEVGYNSDISDNYEEITISNSSSGVFGGMSWGDGTIWGGQGDQSQIRTYIPLKKQRCRFLGCQVVHRIALESFQLYGLSLSVRGYSIKDRDYK